MSETIDSVEFVTDTDRILMDMDTVVFDTLPKQIRWTIASAPYGVMSEQTQSLLRNYSISMTIDLIRNHQRRILQAGAARWREWAAENLPDDAGDSAILPHIAAKATLMYTRPIDETMPRRRKRRQTWRIRPTNRSGDDSAVY